MKNLLQLSIRVLSLTMLMALVLLPITALAATTTISDQASCEAVGGSWDGNCTLDRGYTVGSGNTLTYIGNNFYVYVDSSLTVNQGGTINANGPLFRNYAPVTNAGTINVNGFEFGIVWPMTNAATGQIIVRGNFLVADTVTNQGTITVLCGGNITYVNNGTITGNPPQYVDCTAPTAVPTQTPLANANGWNNSNVTVTWHWTDNVGGSGIDGATCTTSTPSSGEGIQTLSATCKDLAGNTGSATYKVKVDKTAPVLTCQQPAPSFSVNQPNARVSASVSDALSGPASPSVSQNVDTSTPGNRIVTVTGTDLAGNTGLVDCGYTVNNSEQTITFPPPAARTYGDAPFALNATASSGLPVSYTSNTTTVCTISGNSVTLVAAGSCSITASQTGNGSYNPATPVTQSFNINKANPTITVANSTFPYDGQSHPATATATGVGGATVAGSFTFSYNPGDTNPPVNAGTYAVTATFTSSDPNYTNGTGTGSVTINKAAQTITLSGVPATATYNTTFTPSASASSGLPVTIAVSGVCSLSNGVVTMTSGTGTCVVTASQAGDNNYNPASTSQTVTAQKASQTITFNTPVFNYFPYPSGNNTFTVGASVSSGLPVSFSASGLCSVSGTTVTVTGVGACVITASQNGDNSYAPAQAVSRTFQVVPNPTGYDLLSFGNLTMTSTSTDGTIGVLGNASFQGTNLATANTGPNAVQVQGNVSFGNWGNRVTGNVVYSGSLLNKYVTFARGSFVQNSNTLPTTLQNYAQAVSAAWVALPANGTVVYKFGQIILTGSNASQNVFSLDGSKLSMANSLAINAPAGSAIILNITGTSDSLHNMGIQLSGPNASKVVYNFYQATSLTINSVKVEGTVWAANASVTLSSALLNGSVVAGSTSDSSDNYRNVPLTISLPAV